MPSLRRACLLIAALAGLAALPARAQDAPPASVSIVTVAPEALPVINELPGRIAPTRIAEVRPRVSGIIVERVFEQGSQVSEGDVLYRIDPAPFRVQMASAEATLQRARAAQLNARQCDCANKARFVVAHPVNPPHLVPVVEIVPAPWTDPDTVTRTRDLMERVGQAPVVVTREVPGFILNRLQGALLDEAWSLFDQGYATAEDIDRTIKFGLGLRWSFMGPFETIDLNAPLGIDDYARRLGPMYEELARGRRPAGAWSEDAVRQATEERRAALPQDRIDARREWRDKRLMALRASQSRLDS